MADVTSRRTTFAARLLAGQRCVLLAVGDSLTAGYMVSEGYVEKAARTLRGFPGGPRMELAVRGECGDTAQGGLARLKTALKSCFPDLVLFQFGLNDCYSGVPVKQFFGSVVAAVRAVKGVNPSGDVVLVPPPPLPNRYDDALAEPFREALVQAESEGALVAPVVATWRAFTGNAPLFLADGVHPTGEGYRLMAEAVVKVIMGE